MGRELDGVAGQPAPPLPAGFVDDVMSAIAAEPSPRPVSAAAQALRAGRPVALLAAVVDAWRVAFGGGRPGIVRAPALALLLVAAVALTSVLSLGGYAAAGALGLLDEPSTPVIEPSPSPTPSPTPSPSISPSPSPSPPLTPSPSPSASASPSPTETDEAEETEDPSDDGGGSDNSGPGSENSGGGSGDR
jgi:hypothetical protein